MSKIAKIFAPDPPKMPPPPPPLPRLDTGPAAAAVATKTREVNKRAMGRRGLARTNLTGGQGITEDASVARKSLLGG
jgi:hypothetical protein